MTDFDTTTPLPDVRRVLPSEMPDFLWAVPLMCDDFGLTPAAAERQMRAWPLHNHYSAVTCGGAIGLAQINYDMLSTTPDIQEVFVYLGPTGTVRDGLAMQAHWIRWGKTVGAARFWFPNTAPLPEVRKAYPDVRWRKTWFVELKT